MKNRIVIALLFLIFFSTFTSNQKIIISKFNLKEISVENNVLIKDEDIKKIIITDL